MKSSTFFRRATTPTLKEIVEWTGAVPSSEADLSAVISVLAPLEEADAQSLVYMDNPKYVSLLAQTKAAACLVSSRYKDYVPKSTIALVVAEPYRAFGLVGGRMFPDALRPLAVFETPGISPGAFIHPEARLESDVTIDPGVVVGPRAEIGSGTILRAHAVIGPDVCIGRDCSIGIHASVTHALIGDRVILHPGVRIGQDGFGFWMSPKGHKKVPQLGRVIIQNDVEIGANTTIDRGATRDTIIGEGTHIDNLVQIAHNVVTGRHCVIVAQAGISGSTELGDFAALGGQAGLTGHLKIGAGAQIGAQSGVMGDVPPGARYVGSPAQPARDYFRSVAFLRKQAEKETKKGSSEHPSSELLSS